MRGGQGHIRGASPDPGGMTKVATVPARWMEAPRSVVAEVRMTL